MFFRAIFFTKVINSTCSNNAGVTQRTLCIKYRFAQPIWEFFAHHKLTTRLHSHCKLQYPTSFAFSSGFCYFFLSSWFFRVFTLLPSVWCEIVSSTCSHTNTLFAQGSIFIIISIVLFRFASIALSGGTSVRSVCTCSHLILCIIFHFDWESKWSDRFNEVTVSSSDHFTNK